MLAHRSSYLRTALVRGQSSVLISCSHTVCFFPPMFALAHMRAALADTMGNQIFVRLSTALA